MNFQTWYSQNGADSTTPTMKLIFSRISAPPKTSVTSSSQSPLLPVPRARRSLSSPQYGARMNSPRPCSYHQNATAVPISTNSRAMPTRLRSSRRWPIRVIVAASSRGRRRERRSRDRPAGVTGGTSPAGSAAVVGGGRASLLGTRPGLGGARLRGAGLGLVVHRTRGDRRGLDLPGHRGGLGLVLGADVVVLHALHLALEDPHRAAQRARGVRQLLVTEEQQDGQDDQADLRGAESDHGVLRHVGLPTTLRRNRGRTRGIRGVHRPRKPGVQPASAGRSARCSAARAAAAWASASSGRTSRSSPRSSRASRPAAPNRL